MLRISDVGIHVRQVRVGRSIRGFSRSSSIYCLFILYGNGWTRTQSTLRPLWVFLPRHPSKYCLFMLRISDVGIHVRQVRVGRSIRGFSRSSSIYCLFILYGDGWTRTPSTLRPLRVFLPRHPSKYCLFPHAISKYRDLGILQNGKIKTASPPSFFIAKT